MPANSRLDLIQRLKS